MPLYQIFSIAPNGTVHRGREVRCVDDQAALTEALGAVVGYGMAEVWRGSNRVFIVANETKRLRPWDMPKLNFQGFSVLSFGNNWVKNLLVKFR